MMLSVFFVSLISLGVRLLRHIPAVEVIFFNSLAALVTSFVTLRYHQVSVWGKNHGLLLARGIVGTVGVTLYFFTLQHMPLPSAITLRYTAPIFAALLGIFIVKESVRLQQWFFFGLSFGGIVLINGFALTDTSWYILVGLVGAFFGGLSNNLIRKIEQQEHPLVIAFYAYLITVPLAGTYLLYNFVALEARDVLVICIISVLGYLAHYYSVKAYQLGPVATVSATAYFAVTYALLFSYVFLNETLPGLKLLGLGFVLLGVLLNLFYHKRASNSSNSKLE